MLEKQQVAYQKQANLQKIGEYGIINEQLEEKLYMSIRYCLT